MKKLFWILQFLVIACSSSDKIEVAMLDSNIVRTFRGDTLTTFSWDVYPYTFEYRNLNIIRDSTIIFSESGYMYNTYVSDGILTGSFIIPEQNSSRYLVFGGDTLSSNFDDLLFKYTDKDDENVFNTYLDILNKSGRKVYLSEKYCVHSLIEKNIYKSYHYNNQLLLPDNNCLQVLNDDFVVDISANQIFQHPKRKSLSDFKENFKYFDSLKNLKIWHQPNITTKRIEQKGGLMEVHLNKMKDKLNLKDEIIINVYWFKDQKSASLIINQPLGFAIPSKNTIYIHDKQSIGHEVNHIVAYYAYGKKQSRFLDEGFATFYDANNRTWQELKKISNYMEHWESLTSCNYFEKEQELNYYIAGSLVGYIIERYGLEKFELLYKDRLWYNNLESILGLSIEQLLNEWSTN